MMANPMKKDAGGSPDERPVSAVRKLRPNMNMKNIPIHTGGQNDAIPSQILVDRFILITSTYIDIPAHHFVALPTSPASGGNQPASR